MPTPEEIKKIAREYAEYMCPVGDYCGGVYDDQRNADLPIYKDDAKSVLQWLSKDYCIVPKIQMQMRHASCVALAEADPARKDMYICQKKVLEIIFGTALFNEEKE